VSKNILTKALLLLVVVLLSATLLTGCSLFSKTATVKLSGTTAALAEDYSISVDDGGTEGTITGDETLEITGLSIGKHTFYADSTNYSGEETKTITGLWAPTVTIPVE